MSSNTHVKYDTAEVNVKPLSGDLKHGVTDSRDTTCKFTLSVLFGLA